MARKECILSPNLIERTFFSMDVETSASMVGKKVGELKTLQSKTASIDRDLKSTVVIRKAKSYEIR